MKYALLLLLLVGACSSSDSGWESAARRINGELAALRPTVHAIAEIATKDDPASVRAVVGMCASMDIALERIAKTHLAFHALDHEPGGPHQYMTDVPDHARWLIQDRYDFCRGDDWRCRDWCVKSWKGLAESVDALQARAAKHGVYLESLTQ